jgi:hypothetical protein
MAIGGVRPDLGAPTSAFAGEISTPSTELGCPKGAVLDEKRLFRNHSLPLTEVTRPEAR